MSKLIEELQKLPKDSTEFQKGFNMLIDNVDSLTTEEQILFASLCLDFVNEAENERIKIR